MSVNRLIMCYFRCPSYFFQTSKHVIVLVIKLHHMSNMSFNPRRAGVFGHPLSFSAPSPQKKIVNARHSYTELAIT